MLTPDAFVKVYGYTEGCEPCHKIKDLLWRHNITFTFIPVSKDCPHRRWLRSQGHDTVPQVYMDQTYIGNYGMLKNHLEPQEANNELTSLLGWLPQGAPEYKPQTLRPAINTPVETEEKSNGKTASVSKTMRKAKREDASEERVEACFINPLTGQRECS